MQTKDIRLGDLIEFNYEGKKEHLKQIQTYTTDTKPKIKGLVTRIERERFENSPHGDTDFAIFTVRDNEYYQYNKYEERKMENIHEVLELSVPLTDREKQIIRFYENHISNMYDTVDDKVRDVRSKIDEATHELAGIEQEVFGDLEEGLIEELEEQEAEERRKAVEYYSGKRKEVDWLKEVK